MWLQTAQKEIQWGREPTFFCSNLTWKLIKWDKAWGGGAEQPAASPPLAADGWKGHAALLLCSTIDGNKLTGLN